MNNYFSSKDARELSENSDSLIFQEIITNEIINNILLDIEDCAKNGGIYIRIRKSESTIKVKLFFENLGYKVIFEKNLNIIKW